MKVLWALFLIWVLIGGAVNFLRAFDAHDFGYAIFFGCGFAFAGFQLLALLPHETSEDS